MRYVQQFELLGYGAEDREWEFPTGQSENSLFQLEKMVLFRIGKG